jgi:hypothetical protein
MAASDAGNARGDPDCFNVLFAIAILLYCHVAGLHAPAEGLLP